jgi:ABC-type transporter Mla MlaB component
MRLNQRNKMLRITLHQEGRQCRLELVGRLCGPWVGEAENAWRSAQCSTKEIEVDMRDVTGIDDAGRALLAAMHRAGARLIAKGLWMTALVDEITGERPFDGTKRLQRRKDLSHNEDFWIRRDSE